MSAFSIVIVSNGGTTITNRRAVKKLTELIAFALRHHAS
jgi:hypothetical protein